MINLNDARNEVSDTLVKIQTGSIKFLYYDPHEDCIYMAFSDIIKEFTKCFMKLEEAAKIDPSFLLYVKSVIDYFYQSNIKPIKKFFKKLEKEEPKNNGDIVHPKLLVFVS